jgi:arylsulfatase A-like enzyme
MGGRHAECRFVALNRVAGWLVSGAVILALLLGAFVLAGPSLLIRFPVLIGIVAQLREPIGPTRDVVWEAGPSTSHLSASERPPNIVVILVDDLGWNDLTWNGGGVAGGRVPTPNMNSIASNGVEFTQGYAGNATCAPSRAALMTGRYPQRFGFESTPAPAAMGMFMSVMMDAAGSDGAPRSFFHEDVLSEVPSMEEQGVPTEELMLPEVLAGAGYHSVMLGKWHLGETVGQRPVDQGFDEFLGFFPGGAMYGDPEDPAIVSAKQDFDPVDQFIWKILPYAIRKDNEPRYSPDLYMTDYLSREAVQAIEANRHRPFFMYLAYNAPHTPLQATQADYDALPHIESHPERVYAAMIRSLDRGVGEVLDALKANGLEENTLVVFSSDNGGAHYIGLPDVNKPYRGWKMTFFEGGLRAPFFMKWPARIVGGTTSSEPATHIDIFTTVATAGGAALPADRKIDGIDLIPYSVAEVSDAAELDTVEASTGRGESLFWRSGQLSVVRSEGWKLQVDGRQGKRWLFDLVSDPTEQRNLIESSPAKAAELASLLNAQNKELGPRSFPVLLEAPIPIDRTLADAYVPGEEFVFWAN